MKSRAITISIGLFAMVTIAFTSCAKKKPTQYEIVLQNVEEYIKSIMNDPDSYEFVSLELKDSVLFSDNIEYYKDYHKKNIEDELHLIELYEKSIYSSYPKEISDIKLEIEKNKIILEKIDSLETQLAERTNEVAIYIYHFTCRGNNSFGAKQLNNFELTTNPAPDFKVIDAIDEYDEYELDINYFPDYKEIIEKYN